MADIRSAMSFWILVDTPEAAEEDDRARSGTYVGAAASSSRDAAWPRR